MTAELIIVLVSVAIIFLVYLGRFKAKNRASLIFSSSFLMKADDVIFHLVMFVYKLYSLVVSNIVHFFKEVPHKVADIVHKASHATATKSHTLKEKFKPSDQVLNQESEDTQTLHKSK